MQIRNAILAETATLPALGDLVYQFVLAGNGLYIRAEDSRLRALIPVCDDVTLHGLADVEPYAELQCERVPEPFLWSVWQSARRHLPNEVLFQFTRTDRGWYCAIPESKNRIGGIEFQDDGDSVIDLHSHGAMMPFFSETDNEDEQGLRFYVVVGQVETEVPTMRCRVGVYGHTWEIAASTIFEGLGPFVDLHGSNRTAQVAPEPTDAEVEEIRKDLYLDHLPGICERLGKAGFHNWAGDLTEHEDFKLLQEIADDWKAEPEPESQEETI